ncbi:MAG: hypothetical protein OEX07_03785 [Gammaproteobacteria bacterium]|nr:hypothetical protein [Gammaproteobacteria bacterium]
MRKLILIITSSIMAVSISACFDNGHSHTDGSHSHGKTEQHDPQKHHDTIKE